MDLLGVLQQALQQWPCPRCGVGNLSLGENLKGELIDAQLDLVHQFLLMVCDNVLCKESVFLDTFSDILTCGGGDATERGTTG